MNIRKLSLAIVSIAVIAPVVASASPEDVALNACAKAFASSISGLPSAPTYKLNYDQSRRSETSMMGFYVHDYSFTLKAHDPKTGVALASATCSADTRGDVLALKTDVVRSEAKLAAR